MVNIKMIFYHPKYYKELRKRNKSDQVISLRAHDGECERAPGQGQSLTRDSNADGGEGSSSKRQASSVKPQAASDSQVVNQVELSSQSQAASKPEPVQVQASSAKRQASQPE